MQRINIWETVDIQCLNLQKVLDHLKENGVTDLSNVSFSTDEDIVGSYYPTMEYSRLETDEEHAKRLKKEELYNKRREEDERITYERLKVKYG